MAIGLAWSYVQQRWLESHGLPVAVSKSMFLLRLMNKTVLKSASWSWQWTTGLVVLAKGFEFQISPSTGLSELAVHRSMVSFVAGD